YKISSGDTIDSIAKKYQANRDRVVAFNDLELAGVPVGRTIIIPGGVLPQTERPGYTAPITRSPALAYGSTSETGHAVSSAFARASVGNRYAFGNCTWYAYE